MIAQTRLGRGAALVLLAGLLAGCGAADPTGRAGAGDIWVVTGAQRTG